MVPLRRRMVAINCRFQNLHRVDWTWCRPRHRLLINTSLRRSRNVYRNKTGFVWEDLTERWFKVAWDKTKCRYRRVWIEIWCCRPGLFHYCAAPHPRMKGTGTMSTTFDSQSHWRLFDDARRRRCRILARRCISPLRIFHRTRCTCTNCTDYIACS